MNLPFSTHFPSAIPTIGGEPTYFVDKIWLSIAANQLIDDCIFRSEKNKYLIEHWSKTGLSWEFSWRDYAKHHTIREGNRFKTGDKLHMVIYNRTKKRFQFCPVLEVVSTQSIFMTYAYNDIIEMTIGSKYIFDYQVKEQLALNDGFESYEHFFCFFHHYITKKPDQEFSGQIIHWTPIRY